MYERYMICEETVRNICDGDSPSGFALDVRIAYYRGIVLSMVDGIEVSVDGETFDRDAISFAVRDRVYSLDELLEADTDRWEFGERANLRVKKPGGLDPGPHELHVAQELRIPYMPGGRLRGVDTKQVEVS